MMSVDDVIKRGSMNEVGTVVGCACDELRRIEVAILWPQV